MVIFIHKSQWNYSFTCVYLMSFSAVELSTLTERETKKIRTRTSNRDFHKIK